MSDDTYVEDTASSEPWTPDADAGLDASPAWWTDDEVTPLSEDPSFTGLDYGPSVLLVDSDYSGSWNHASVDVDGDGTPEVLVSVQGDNLALVVDTDGDGLFDHTELVTPEQLAALEPELAALLSEGLALSAPEDATFTPTQVDYDEIAEESPYWFEQAANGLCVPASVAQIIAEYTGVTFDSEAAFVEIANEYGLFMVGPDGVPGMTVEGALFLMEQAGVPASLVMSANIDLLESYVDAGHGVVLFVNSSDIWYGEEGAGAADHALVVTDIDQEAGVAVLSDPGTPEGNALTVPLEVLEDAWVDGDHSMLVAESPAPGALSEALDANEAAQVGQVSEVADDAVEPSAPPPSAAPVAVASTSDRLLDSVAPVELSPESAIDKVMHQIVQRPWILLPVAIAASRLATR